MTWWQKRTGLVAVAAVSVLAGLATACGPEPEGVVRIQGSETLGRTLIPDLAEAYLTAHGANSEPVRVESADLVTVSATLGQDAEPTRFEISLTDPVDGFTALAHEDVDLVMGARAPTDSLPGSNGAPETVIAMDAVVAVKNLDNPVEVLTRQNLKDMFRCGMPDWSAVNGGSGPISLFVPAESAGGYRFMRDLVLDGAEPCANVRKFRTDSELATAVAADPTAIGLVASSSIAQQSFPKDVVTIKIAGEAGPVPALSSTIADGRYPLVRMLALYRRPGPARRGPAMDFLRSIRDGEERAVIERAGFVVPPPTPEPGPTTTAAPTTTAEPAPTSDPGTTPNPSADCPGEDRAFCDFVGDAVEQRVLLLFDVGDDELSAGAVGELDRLAEELRLGDRRGDEIMLAGFTDNRGSEQANRLLGRTRAENVAQALRARTFAVPETNVRGFGSDRPVNAADDRRNRRVEVWLRVRR